MFTRQCSQRPQNVWVHFRRSVKSSSRRNLFQLHFHRKNCCWICWLVPRAFFGTIFGLFWTFPVSSNGAMTKDLFPLQRFGPATGFCRVPSGWSSCAGEASGGFFFRSTASGEIGPFRKAMILQAMGCYGKMFHFHSFPLVGWSGMEPLVV